MYEWPHHGMTYDRYKEISEELTKDLLTAEERTNGWYFSEAFDYLLIHSSWPEAELD